MPGEIRRASAVMTLTVSVIVTLMLVLAAETRHTDPAPAGSARQTLSR